MPKILNNTQIKYLAAFFMVLDHLALILIPNDMIIYVIFRSIGRLAAPLFFWAIAEGAFHTKNIYKYLYKLLAFGIIFHIVYMFVIGERIGLVSILTSYKNIFITLALGLGGIILIKKNDNNKLISFFSIVVFSYLGLLLNVDYSWYGVMMIIMFYLFRNKNLKLLSFIILLNFTYFFLEIIMGMSVLWSSIQVLSIFSLLFIFMYNGQKGNGNRYFFYIFYPVHLMILYAISYFF